jgi:hypothetical protein
MRPQNPGSICRSAALLTAAIWISACGPTQIPDPDDGCESGFSDCNGDPADGCEHYSAANGVCVCTPGSTESCYEGPAGTANRGRCARGTRTCAATGLSFGACEGQVLPQAESCTSDSVDDDCDGVVDNVPDADGDGWTTCDGDCCDGTGCATPASVNPGAFEIGGNAVDDDCDGTTDGTAQVCDSGLASNASGAADYAKALELCRTSTEAAGPDARKWGVISAGFSLADGTGAPSTNARSLRGMFGSAVLPLSGERLVVLSTGHAAAPGHTLPSFAEFEPGTALGNESPLPTDWLAANGGVIPRHPACPPIDDSGAFDSTMLTLRVRVPTNARSFKLRAYFFSSEFPEFVCTPYNDVFVALLDSTATTNPADKNLAFFVNAQSEHIPMNVNLAYGDAGPFVACRNGEVGCAGTEPGATTGCASPDDLTGTGFEGSATGCADGDQVGGGTGWVNLAGNVTPGEIATLRLALWDTADGVQDSLVLLDQFEWSSEETTPGLTQ